MVLRQSETITSTNNHAKSLFFNITTPKFAAQAIRRAGEIGWDVTQFLVSVSNAKSAVLEPAGLDHSIDIISTQYLKEPTNPAFADDPDMKAWKEFKANYFPAASDGNWWDWSCYSTATTLEHVLTQAGDELTRENLMKVASNLDGFEAPMLLPGITVNTVSPGLIHTPDLEAGYRARASKKGWGDNWDDILAHIVREDFPNPCERLASREEVADLVAFLCSDAANWITGQIFGTGRERVQMVEQPRYGTAMMRDGGWGVQDLVEHFE